MEHKAYVFDTNIFNQELRPIIISSGRKDDPKKLKKFINDHIEEMYSPYSLEPLEDEWEDELENEDVQEYSDFAMTYLYSPEDDIGLAYSWDALLEILKKLPKNFDAEYCVLGRAVQDGDFVLDPGREGMGFVEAEDVSGIYHELINGKEEFEKLAKEELPTMDTLYDINYDELIEAYTQLISIYQEADDQKLGLMMTF